MILSRACLLLLVPTLVVACSSTSPSGLPAGVTCSSPTNAADSAALTTALAGAKDGSCVVASGGSYSGTFTVPPGVTLTSGSGGRATLTGGDAKTAVVTLGERAVLGGIDVTNGAGVGVAVRAGTATLSDVHVTSAKNAALAVLCTGSCGSIVSLTNVNLEKSALGLWVSGAHVVWAGGRSAEHASTSLAAAYGVVAQDGARIELTNVTVEKNQGTGVLVDGDKTTATITDSNVQDNDDRGIWAQKVTGTVDNPSVTIKGTNLVRNKIAGVGAVEAHGIIIVGGRVAETIAAPVVTDLASTEQVGDGIGIFASTNIKIDGAVVEQNARAAGVIDHSETGIIIVGGRVAAGASGLKFVVQNASSSADVQIPADSRSTTTTLGVSAPKLTLPPVL